MKTFIVLFIALFVVSEGENVFEKLAMVNEQWLLRFTSFPEAAFLLKSHPMDTVPTGNAPRGVRSCGDDLIEIVENIESNWALQMLDSDGKLESGLLRGGVIWPGHFGECVDVYAPEDSTGRHGGFNGQYCVTSWTMNVSKKYSNLPLSVGMCFPDSCSAEYLLNFGEDFLDLLERLPVLKDHKSVLTLKSVTCKLKEQKLDTSSLVYLCFIFYFLCMSLVGTFLHSRKNSVTMFPLESSAGMEKESSAIDTSAKRFSIPRTLCETDTTDKEMLTPNIQQDTLISPTQHASTKFWQCFSMIENGRKILKTKSSGDQLLSIHGIRFLSLTWVILGHTYITPVSIIGNRLDVLKLMDSFLYQILLQTPFSVDAFFLLSGFLLTYLFLKEADKRNGKINWIYFYVHRIWRLTPAYMVVVFFYLIVFKYLGSGPFWDDNHCDASRGSWWKYLLYINNFIPINDMCVGWSWYLANDMQFYLTSPFFLYPLWRWPVIGFSLLISLLIGTWTTTAIISYQNDIVPMFVGVTHTSDFAAYTKKMWESFDLIYDKPYCRIAPYVIGVMLGFVLYKLNKRKRFMNWWQQAIGWIVAASCGLSVMFGLYHADMSRTAAFFYNSLSRTAFSIALAWIIFVCETGHGGAMNKLLSWKFWMPLSRLTYSAYLIHPIFIHAYYNSFQTAYFFTDFIAVTTFLGFLVMSYSTAFIFSTVFESPLMNLEKLILKRQ
ncbi:nose resistant to fluoxetine protein 6-like [Parasteatoda tepidariorum]|uniref:nose resistant to fluoxetine protein 6-like n=1 Tax=Parasteatoda tepidariorum TaxID=114398 RepID=UPI00077F8758|nr:nose resistant to fluoxetine protein 6-like [Parasteatoda tepidariorum]